MPPPVKSLKSRKEGPSMLPSAIGYLTTCESNRFWWRFVPSFTEEGKKYLVRFERVDEDIAGVEYDYTCTCPDFYYRKRYCKHIKSVTEKRCGWHQKKGGGIMSTGWAMDSETAEFCCPKCGGPVEFYGEEV